MKDSCIEFSIQSLYHVILREFQISLARKHYEQELILKQVQYHNLYVGVKNNYKILNFVHSKYHISMQPIHMSRYLYKLFVSYCYGLPYTFRLKCACITYVIKMIACLTRPFLVGGLDPTFKT